MKRSITIGPLALLVAFQALTLTAARPQTGSIAIKTLSTRADRVSGGDVLVEISAPGAPTVTLNGRDISAAFHPRLGSDAFTALVSNLAIGRNVLKVAGKAWSARDESLEVINYPITGPIISGPHQAPYLCQTDTFKLPDGSTLGPAADANCSAATRVQYVYLPKGAKDFKPLPDSKVIPADAARATTTARKNVPFVVRVETGTINRGIYQNLVLHDPAADPAPTPFSPPPAAKSPGRSRRMLYV